MFINKIGNDHIEFGKNCQDFGVIRKDQVIVSSIHDNSIIKSDIKIVCDGCSEGLHSEVGAKTFIHLMQYYNNDIKIVFSILKDIFGQTISSMKDFLSFTILYVIETEDNFEVYNCGDGYCITENKNGEIEFTQFDCGEYPEYFVYNYIDSKYLMHYTDGVKFNKNVYSKEIYTRVGVASDGIRFVFNQPEEFQCKFRDILHSDKSSAMKRFINMNQKLFKDDITIAL